MALNITLTLNGEARAFPAPLSVAALIESLTLPTPRVAVLLNDEVVKGGDHAATALHDGDTVDIISMVGGG